LSVRVLNWIALRVNLTECRRMVLLTSLSEFKRFLVSILNQGPALLKSIQHRHGAPPGEVCIITFKLITKLSSHILCVPLIIRYSEWPENLIRACTHPFEKCLSWFKSRFWLPFQNEHTVLVLKEIWGILEAIRIGRYEFCLLQAGCRPQTAVVWN
jgi:hypothetical protein